MKILALIQGKMLVVTVASVALLGGATAAFAATPVGSQVVHSVVAASHGDSSTHAKDPAKSDSTHANHKDVCPGLTDAQRLAKEFSLSAKSAETICSLHQGTFKGTTTAGASASSDHALGYGEIEKLLVYAQYLAKHDGSKLTDSNVLSYLAQALKTCGSSSSIEACLKAQIPNYQPGNGKAQGSTQGSSSDHSHDQGNGGKPSSTPTPPTGTPTARPTATPTPHH